jgi:outer membrane protein assembly factor BamB
MIKNIIALLLVFASIKVSIAADWPAWRGPDGTGVSAETDLPIKWSAVENIRWRVALPEPGNSTPIVFGDRVFVTQAIGARRTLMCFNRSDGELLWQQVIETNEKEPTHATNPYCSASPVTDGQCIIVSFASDGLFCYDLSGKQLWQRTDLGRQIHIWGGGASPMIHSDLCFLNFGPGEETYLLALDKTTGQTVWKNDENTGYTDPPLENAASPASNAQTKRDTYIGSWTTPTIMTVDGQQQLLMSWPGRLVAYDPRTGKELWHSTGLNPLVYTSPIFADGIVVAMGGFSGAAIAVRAGGSGDVTQSRRLWLHSKTPQRIGSGVIKDGHIYVHNDPGIAECYDLESGDLIWKERLAGKGGKGTNWSSIMLAGDLCYTINQGGDCFVFKASPKFELVSVNSLNERSNASIAASEGELFIRTHEALWCIGKKD